MTGTTFIIRFGVVLTMVLASTHATAWGPRAQRTITGMAMQVIQHKYPDTFRPGDAKYEADVLRGAEAGAAIIAETLPIHSDEEAIQAVGIQIQLLRDIRPTGAGSYFAFRMGALSALISDIFLPYGLAWTPEQEAMQMKVEADINDHLKDFEYINSSTTRTAITNVDQHFRAQLAFYGDNEMLIADDYRRGRGYNGFLKESVATYFAKAVETTADAWYTIVRPQPSNLGSAVTGSLMEQYYVEEIAYLLSEKENFHQAGVVYENLSELSPSDPEVFEAVADHYYAFGTRESIERSVKEWRNAYELGGSGRERVSGKLAAHYLKEGRDFLTEAEEKGKGETELPSALASFQQALRFDRTSQVAVDLIQETNKRKKERDEHRSMIVNIIAKAESAREEAENNGTGGNFGLAIKGYQQVMNLLQGVDDEFTDQFDLAEEMKRNVTQSISSTIGDVQEQASAAIEQGERLEETHKYEEAIREYERVPVIVTVIPDDHTASAKQGKLDAIALAEAKIAKARSAKTAYEQSMKGAGRPGAAPAAPAAPAARAGGRNRDRE